MHRLRLAASCLPSLLAIASVPAAASQDQDGRAAQPIQQVEVRGPGVVEQRRNDVLGRIVVGREDLQRFGDTNLSEALKRQPGVSVSGGEIRLRGLGSGYTQILIDGDPAPAGFAVDALSPDLVERIEIQRSAQADASAQAIAGTINVIMRKATGAPRRTLKLGAAEQGGLASPSGAMQWTGRRGAAAWGVGVTLDASHRRSEPLIDERTRDATDTAVRRFAGQNDNRADKLSIAPRLDIKQAGGDTLAWQGFIDLARTDGRFRRQETTLQGSPTASPDARERARYASWLGKSDLTWTRRIGDARLNLKAGVEANGRDGDYYFDGRNAAGTPWLYRTVTSGAFEQRASTSGKLVLPLAAGHDIAVGWDAAATHRREARLQHDTVPGSNAPPFFTLDQDYGATVDRVALFAQDEWTIGERLQAYLGLRWEGLDTRTEGRAFAGAATTSSVFSPVTNLVWKLPGSARDQLRVSLARTYKAPQPADMVPRRYTVNNDNSAVSPDYQGNPQLRPELAWGLDAALEAYFARDAMLSVSVYARRIRDVTLLRLWNENGTWVSMPFNGGSADVRGIEIDGKAPLPAPRPGWPSFELRANLARNWSRLNSVAGPDNRLADQAPLTLNLGGDARFGGGVTAGANLHLVGGYRARSAASLVEKTAIVRELEAYTAWKTRQGQWRLAFADVLRPLRRSERIYDDGATASDRLAGTRPRLTVRLQLEMLL